MDLRRLWNENTGNAVSEEEWSSWTWQSRNAVGDLHTLKKFIPLSKREEEDVKIVLNHFRMSVTPHYLSLVSSLFQKGEADDAKSLLLTFLPSTYELIDEETTRSSIVDGLGEEGTTPYPFLYQLYEDRLLFFVTHYCPFYCRYCFRRRKVIPRSGGFTPPQAPLSKDNLGKVIEYISSRPKIRDVILSGGEPLSLADERLEEILAELRKIQHVKIIRIDTKIPAVMPMRITDKLVDMLRKYHPLFMTLHFVHPVEITEEAKEACEKLVDAGIPLGTYTPVLRGVNDDREVLKELFWKLVLCRVRPYYLVQFVPTKWAEHFRIPLLKSLKLLEGIHGEISGIAIPTFKVYTPGSGKIPLLPQYYVRKTEKGHILKSWRGEEVLYEEPEGS
jgi:lysine 2,3-aminomutase